MPHDVIMPALGMAQDTGKIVAWLKQSGDPVKVGEAIMEVETDKATMEVEAQADGFLTGITASAGDDVPVGQPVATISETADEIATPSPAPTNKPQVVPPPQNDPPVRHSALMPALGMAQDTGLIVAWRNSPGDRVASSDVLLEVETDKSVMEVEAGHDGFVAAILAQAQEAVPVGSVIAIISDRAPENPASRSLASGSGSSRNQAPEPPANGSEAPPQPAHSATPPATDPARSTSPGAGTPAPGDRILASPKARRLAREQGLDLNRLVEHGVAQPFHVADLETLRALPAVSPVGEAAGAAAPALHLSARVSISGCDDFIRWLAEDARMTPDPALLWLRFAAAALRDAGPAGLDQLVLGIDRPGADTVHYADPDLARVSQPQTAEPEESPQLLLRDLTGSLLTSVRLTADLCPVLTIGRDETAYALSLDFSASQLTEIEAIRFLTNFAERLQEPLRHIL